MHKALTLVYGRFMAIWALSKIKRHRWKDLVAPPSEGEGGSILQCLYLFSNVSLKLMFLSIISYMACDIRVLTKKGQLFPAIISIMDNKYGWEWFTSTYSKKYRYNIGTTEC